MSKIKISHHIVDFHWLSDAENMAAQRFLERHYHGLVRPRCLCLNDHRNRELVIKKRRYFFLAKISHTGGHHAEWCEQYVTQTLTLSHDGKLPAIIEKGDTLNVKLNCYLNVSHADPSKTKAGQATTRTGKSRSEVTLLGFLNLCLQKSRINTWFLCDKNTKLSIFDLF
jgi:hypothetical protein